MPRSSFIENIVGGTPFHIGDIVVHTDGYKVKIISGQYWGERGLSNFWSWRKVLDNDKLGEEDCGYGYKLQGC